ncbi:MAG: hypothetical protein WCE20_03730 [Rhizomicrobium sp.]
MSAQIDSTDMQAVFAKPRHDGCFEGALLQYARRISNLRRIIVLAFPPKAASTFLCQAATYAVDGQHVRTPYALGGRDGSFYLPTIMVSFLDRSSPITVTHIHMQAFNSNRHFIEAFNLKPVIMIRSIPDALASFCDMMDSTEQLRIDGFQCVIPPDFLDMDRETKINFIVDMFAPWYVSYYASWKSYVDCAPERICVLHYDEFREDPADCLHRAVVHSGLSITKSKCEESVERARSEREQLKYNKGVGGRGKEYFSQAHLMRIASMLAYYPQLKPWMSELMGVAKTPVAYLAQR